MKFSLEILYRLLPCIIGPSLPAIGYRLSKVTAGLWNMNEGEHAYLMISSMVLIPITILISTALIWEFIDIETEKLRHGIHRDSGAEESALTH